MRSATFYIDVDGGLLLGSLVVADKATHIMRPSLGDVQGQHPIDLLCIQGFGPTPSPPLSPAVPLAMQVKGLIKLDDEVGSLWDDTGLWFT